MFNDEQKAALEAKLDASAVKSRQQGGRGVSYIEAWHAIAEANRIFGFDGWDRTTIEIRQLGEPYQNEKQNWVVAYMARVRVTVYAGTDREIERHGSGFGSGFSKNVGDAHESAIKEAETDAMKRALMTFGNPFGLALYDKTQANVETCDKPKGNGKVDTKGTPSFWERESYALPTTAKGKPDWVAWDKAILAAIGKCPDLERLSKLQIDNADSLKEYGQKFAVAEKAIMQTFATRMGDLSQGQIE